VLALFLSFKIYNTEVWAFLAFNLTEGYFNPTLATGLKLGCLMEDGLYF
jgi:hypothetical protein